MRNTGNTHTDEEEYTHWWGTQGIQCYTYWWGTHNQFVVCSNTGPSMHCDIVYSIVHPLTLMYSLSVSTRSWALFLSLSSCVQGVVSCSVCCIFHVRSSFESSWESYRVLTHSTITWLIRMCATSSNNCVDIHMHICQLHWWMCTVSYYHYSKEYCSIVSLFIFCGSVFYNHIF